MNAIWPALASMLCAAFNDFLFKLYTRRGASTGAYLAVIGLIWAMVFAALAGFDPRIILGAATWKWGLLSGAFSILANILLLAAMARMDVGASSTIYRLNLAPAALLAVWLLGESMSSVKFAALCCAVGAVILVCRPGRHPGAGVSLSPGGMFRMLNASRAGDAGETCPPPAYGALLLVILACLLRAGMGVSYKAGLLHGADGYGMMAWNGMAWVGGGIFLHRLVGRRRGAGWPTLAFGLPSGALVCGIVLFLVWALQRGEASVVLPVAQLSFVGTSLLGVAILREKFTMRKLAGIALAGLCVVLLATGG